MYLVPILVFCVAPPLASTVDHAAVACDAQLPLSTLVWIAGSWLRVETMFLRGDFSFLFFWLVSAANRLRERLRQGLAIVFPWPRTASFPCT